jgi:uncharacterized protein (DUF302 family)
MNRLPKLAAVAALSAALPVMGSAADALESKDFPYPGMEVIATALTFDELAGRVDQAVAGEGLAVVTRASASAGAERRGIKIPGNTVLGVFRNDFAVRMLAASVPAGIEAPGRCSGRQRGARPRACPAHPRTFVAYPASDNTWTAGTRSGRDRFTQDIDVRDVFDSPYGPG